MLTLKSITSDYVAAPHREAYLELMAALEPQLCPDGALEICAAAEIIGAHWRLRNLQGVEGDTADNVRRAARRGIRQDTAELRRLQFDRRLKAELGLDLPVLISAKDYLTWTNQRKLMNKPNSPTVNPPEPPKTPDPATVADLEARLLKALAKEEQATTGKIVNFTNQSQSVGRNAHCPCHSGHKFKRCCGKGSPPIYQKAA